MARIRSDEKSEVLRILRHIVDRLDAIEKRLDGQAVDALFAGTASGLAEAPAGAFAAHALDATGVALDMSAFAVKELAPELADRIRDDVHVAVRRICHRGNANYLTTSTSVIYPRQSLWLRAAQQIVHITASRYAGYMLGDNKTEPFYGRTVQEFELFLAKDVIDFVAVVGV